MRPIILLFTLSTLSFLLYACFDKKQPARKATIPEYFRDVRPYTGPFDYEKQQGRAAFRTGHREYESKRFFRAHDLLNRALSHHSKNLIARYYFGKAYLRAGFPRNAAQEWRFLSRLLAAANIPWPYIDHQIRGLERGEGDMPALDYRADFSRLFRLEGKLLGKRAFQSPSDLLVNGREEIYICNRKTASILRTDKNGHFRDVIVFWRKPAGRKPLGLALGPGGNLFITDTANNEVLKYSPDFRLEKTAGGSGQKNGKFLSIRYPACDRFGNVYVCDQLNGRVQKFTNDLTFIRLYGDGRLKKPKSVAVASSDRIYVYDEALRSLVVFTQAGQMQKTVAVPGTGPVGAIHADRPGEALFLTIGGQAWRYDIQSSRFAVLSLNRPVSERHRDRRLSAAVSGPAGKIMTADEKNHAIEVFLPDALKTTHYLVRIDHINTKKHPNVQVLFTADNVIGAPVMNLTTANMELFEYDVPVRRFSLVDRRTAFNGLRLTVMMDTTPAMASYRKAAVDTMSLLVKRLTKMDTVELYEFHRQPVKVKEKTAKLYELPRFIRTVNWKRGGKRVDLTVYKGVESVFRTYHQRAVIILTDGRLTADSFKRFNRENCAAYAKYNHVPFFIIAFADNNRQQWKQLARKSGGAYISATNTQQLRALIRHIRRMSLRQYIGVYQAHSIPKNAGQWRTVRLNVNYKNIEGTVTEGYFVPEK